MAVAQDRRQGRWSLTGGVGPSPGALVPIGPFRAAPPHQTQAHLAVTFGPVSGCWPVETVEPTISGQEHGMATTTRGNNGRAERDGGRAARAHAGGPELTVPTIHREPVR